MNAPLSRYLACFSAEPALAPPDDPSPTPAPEPMLTLAVGELEARLEDARREARAAAEAARAAELAEMTARHAEALSTAKAERTTADAEALLTRVDGAFVALHERLAGALAGVLRPIVGDAVRARTLDALVAALGRLTDDAERPAITLRAPAELVDALRRRGVPAGIVLVAADVGEATATVDGTHIETRLQAALADL